MNFSINCIIKRNNIQQIEKNIYLDTMVNFSNYINEIKMLVEKSQTNLIKMKSMPCIRDLSSSIKV